MDKPRLNGWRREPKDERDFKLSAPPMVEVPHEASLLEWSSPNQSQYSTSSCVGNGCANAMELLHIKAKGLAHHDDLSRLFIYWNAREYIGETNRDQGCFIRDAIKGLARYGVCYEKTWGFDTKKVCVEPPANCYREAETMQILQYHKIDARNRLSNVKYAIAQGYPVIFGMDIYESFYKADKGGVVPMPKPGVEEYLGGHCMLLAQYSDITLWKDGLCRSAAINSWGKDWGDNGRCHIPYEIIEDPSLSDDYWVIQLVENPDIQVARPAWYAYLIYWWRRLIGLGR